MTLFIMFIFIVLLCLAVPIGLSVGITSLLPSLLTDSFTAGGVFITRSMLGGVNQTSDLPVFRGDLRFCPCHSGGRGFHDNPRHAGNGV